MKHSRLVVETELIADPHLTSLTLAYARPAISLNQTRESQEIQFSSQNT